MAIGNMELMRECFPKHLRIGTARTKSYKDTDEDGKREALVRKEAKRARKKEVQTAYQTLIKI